MEDHYTLLGLSHLRHAATADDIKKAYHQSALKFHPDKLAHLVRDEKSESAREALKEKIDTHFKKIKQAYEVLKDSDQRQKFDSKRVNNKNSFRNSRTTTTTTSAAKEDDDNYERYEFLIRRAPWDFFKVLRPVFERKAKRFKTPVPGLGHERSPIEEVEKFYEFWHQFLSRSRILKLLEIAYRHDPRIRRKKRIEEEKKRAAKAAEEEKRAAKAAEEEEKRTILEQREKEINRLRRLLSEGNYDLSTHDVEKFCSLVELERLRSLCEGIEKGTDDGEMAHSLNMFKCLTKVAQGA